MDIGERAKTAAPNTGAEGEPTLGALNSQFAALLSQLELLPEASLLQRCRVWTGALAAVEARCLASRVDSDGDTRAAARAAEQTGGVSRAAARRKARRARAVKNNPGLADMAASGRLSGEQLDTIADAAESDDAAANDQDLIDDVVNSTVEQGRLKARDWAQRRASADERQSAHDRQRRNRRATTYHRKDDDLSVIQLAGDSPTIDELWRAIQAEERRLYELDGGRDLSSSKHPRTRDQRLFDATVALLRGKVDGQRGGRPTVVFNVPASKLMGETDACCEQIGLGPIPDSVVIDALTRADLHLTVTGLKGQPLWLGRTRRNASPAQLIALVLRDKGCVLCGAAWQRCEAHHVIPWHAPLAGETNLSNLALLCSPCHHRLHDEKHTLVWSDEQSVWVTRPATRDELPLSARANVGRRRPNPTSRAPADPRAAPQHHRPRARPSPEPANDRTHGTESMTGTERSKADEAERTPETDDRAA